MESQVKYGRLAVKAALTRRSGSYVNHFLATILLLPPHSLFSFPCLSLYIYLLQLVDETNLRLA